MWRWYKNDGVRKALKVFSKQMLSMLCVCVCVCVCEREREREEPPLFL